jgi:diacylglycerol O-acyltransferase / wax synthase
MDQAFFLLETEERPMNIGSLVVVAPPHTSSRQFANSLVRRMLKCPVGPPFNCRLVQTGLAGLPALVEDSHIDPATRVFRHKLPPGSDLQALFEHVCELHVQRLDRRQPLWQMHVFEGLPQGRVALYFKTHHGLIDGIGFIRVALGTVTRSPGSRVPQAIWRGLQNGAARATSPPSEPALPAPLEFVRSAWHAGRVAGDMVRLFWHQGLRDLGLGRGLATPFVSTPDVLKAPPSAHRVMGHCAVPLERVKAIARRSDAKVNDVLLAALDVALSRYLEGRGTPPSRPLVADMPVALQDDGEAGNRITILQVPMGRPGGTPAERLADIVRETRQVKQEVRALTPDTLFLYSILGHAAASAIESLQLGRLPMLANTVISNPAGLDSKVFFNGAAVEMALPVSVVAHHQVLNITATNYASQLHVTFIALREAIPDVQQLADLTVGALDDLNSVFVRRKNKPARRAGARAAQTSKQRASSAALH